MLNLVVLLMKSDF